VVHFPQLWQFAQLLCDYWPIAAVTGQYANEFEAELYQNPPDHGELVFTSMDVLLIKVWLCDGRYLNSE
jgi:hypothetical protein